MVDNQNYDNNYIKPRIYLQSKTSYRTFYLYCVFSFLFFSFFWGGRGGSINSKDTRQVLTVHLNLINKQKYLKTTVTLKHTCNIVIFAINTRFNLPHNSCSTYENLMIILFILFLYYHA